MRRACAAPVRTAWRGGADGRTALPCSSWHGGHLNTIMVASIMAAALAAAATQGNEAASFTSSFALVGGTDVVLSGGASLTAAPMPCIRSGSPHQHSLAQFVAPITPGVTITGVALDYRYSRGYSGAKCSNFTVRAAGEPVYGSPVLSDYPYSKSKPNYSPPVHVDQKGLAIAVPSTGEASHLEIAFDDNDCNVQLLTPLVINMTCTGGPCASFELLPSFFGERMPI